LRLVVFGATGRIGRVIVAEALDRGHSVTAAVRAGSTVPADQPALRVVEASIDDARSVERAVRGHDAVVDSVGGLGHDNPRISIECAEPLVEGLRRAGVGRLLVVGTAGTLEVSPGVMRKDSPGFPELLRGEAQAQAELLDFLRGLPAGHIDWTYFSPPALIEPGERTGRYRLGLDELLHDADGNSFISNEDYAVATLDELETPRHSRRRFTAISA
jgi:putative NADH-flavin reductase